jgi:hypothetical protein
MLRYLPSDAAKVFGPDTARLLGEALDEAWRSLQTNGVYFTSRGQAEATREKLALRIIEMAKQGERDPQRLRADALQRLDRSNLARWKSRSPGL